LSQKKIDSISTARVWFLMPFQFEIAKIHGHHSRFLTDLSDLWNSEELSMLQHASKLPGIDNFLKLDFASHHLSGERKAPRSPESPLKD